MRWNSSADDGPHLSPLELRTLEQIEADLRRDVHLDRVLTPRRVRHTRWKYVPLWGQWVTAALGLALLVIGLLVGPVLIAAPGFLALVIATSSLVDRMSLSPATFGLESVIGEHSDDGNTA